jgi:hypothetical protein
MHPDHKASTDGADTVTHNSSLILQVIALVVLLAAYVGAYYSTVVPMEVHRFGMAAFYGDPYRARALGVLQESWQAFFGPIHWMDRRLRPGTWNP